MEENPFDERDIGDPGKAKEMLRWALDKIRSLEEEKENIKQELQEKSHQLAFMEHKDTASLAFQIQKEADRLRQEVVRKDSEISTLLSAREMRSAVGAPPDAEMEAEVENRDLEISSLQREVESLKRFKSAFEAAQGKGYNEWAEARVKLISEFQKRQEALESGLMRKNEELADRHEKLKQQLLKRQQDILEREWVKLQSDFEEKEALLEERSKALEVAFKKRKDDESERLAQVEVSLKRNWDSRRQELERELKGILQADRVRLLQEYKDKEKAFAEKYQRDLEGIKLSLVRETESKKEDLEAECRDKAKAMDAEIAGAQEEFSKRGEATTAHHREIEKRLLARWARERTRLARGYEEDIRHAQEAFEKRLEGVSDHHAGEISKLAAGYEAAIFRERARSEEEKARIRAELQAEFEGRLEREVSPIRKGFEERQSEIARKENDLLRREKLFADEISRKSEMLADERARWEENLSQQRNELVRLEGEMRARQVESQKAFMEASAQREMEGFSKLEEAVGATRGKFEKTTEDILSRQMEEMNRQDENLRQLVGRERQRLADLVQKARRRYKAMQEDLALGQAREIEAARRELEEKHIAGLRDMEREFQEKTQALKAQRDEANLRAEVLAEASAQRVKTWEKQKAEWEAELKRRRKEIEDIRNSLEDERTRDRAAFEKRREEIEKEARVRENQKEKELREREARLFSHMSYQETELEKKKAAFEKASHAAQQEQSARRSFLDDEEAGMEQAKADLSRQAREFEAAKRHMEEEIQRSVDEKVKESVGTLGGEFRGKEAKNREVFQRRLEELANQNAALENLVRQEREMLGKFQVEGREKERQHAEDMARKEAEVSSRFESEIKSALATFEETLKSRDKEFHEWRTQISEYYQKLLSRERQLSEVSKKDWMAHQKDWLDKEKERLRNLVSEHAGRAEEEKRHWQQRMEEQYEIKRRQWLARQGELEARIRALEELQEKEAPPGNESPSESESPPENESQK